MTGHQTTTKFVIILPSPHLSYHTVCLFVVVIAVEALASTISGFVCYLPQGVYPLVEFLCVFLLGIKADPEADVVPRTVMIGGKVC